MQKILLILLVIFMSLGGIAFASIFPDAEYPVLHKSILLSFGIVTGGVLQLKLRLFSFGKSN